MSAHKSMRRHQSRHNAQRRLIFRRVSRANAIIAANTLKGWLTAHVGDAGMNLNSINRRKIDG